MPKSPDPIRIISMVPSWTETLVTAGIPVVGRTRFCIEPNPEIKTIPVVGGTKDWNWPLIQSLRPDVLILDKEENPRFMSQGHDIPVLATHVQNVQSCGESLNKIHQFLHSKISPSSAQNLHDLEQRWSHIQHTPPRHPDWEQPPGLMEWINQPNKKIEIIYYVIWKNPWMVASPATFIGDVAGRLGFSLSAPPSDSKYPELDLHALDPQTTLLLFSSEPYPFHKKIKELKKISFPSAIVDGQSYSWFGVRSLVFLEQNLVI